jgi:2-iminobutanoate/2-iminopropanoate deaminase
MWRAATLAALALVSIVALQWTSFAQAPAGFEKKTFNYGNWTKGRFSEAITVTGPAKTIFLAGAGAEEEMNGAILHKDNALEQCRYAYGKIRKILAEHGATMSDIVKITAYVTDIRYRDDYSKCRVEAFQGSSLPTHTFVNVSQLAWPHMLVEIDVTAMVAAR